jgi:D-threonate/D-erythronate kinase
MSNKIAIIADDLTGANDSGVQLAKKGLEAIVKLDTESHIQSNPEALIIDTDSRALPIEEARRAVQKAASLLFQNGYKHIYKKIDSTLRGNIAVEVKAVVNVFQPDCVVIVPAYPKLNRVTLEGYHYVNGQFVSESEFSRDAKTPVKESYIPNILQEQFDEKDIIVIPLSFINGDEKKTQEFIRRNLKKGIKLFVCDVETEDDLKSIAQIFSNMKDKDIVWVGSGGLVEYLPEAIGINSSPNKSTKLKTSKPLIISGSLSKVTKLQLETLKKVKNPYVIEVNPVHLVKKTFNIDELLKLDINVDDFDLIILYVDSTEENRESIMRIREELKLSNTQISELIVGGLGQLGKSILERVPDIESLILTGGDTAKAVCRAINVDEITLQTEVEAGMPVGVINSEGKQYWTITKAGGFGKETSLVNAVNYLNGKGLVQDE